MTYSELYVGIDVSKYKHDVAVMNDSKRLVQKPFVIAEDYNGYQYLMNRLNHLGDRHNTDRFYVGMEATGDYWKNLYYFLKNQNGDFNLSVINPVRTKAFAKTELRRAKTDPVNAKDIALFMVEKSPSPFVDRPLIFDCIKDLDRQIYSLKKQRTISLNRFRIELTKVAPEIDRAFRYISGDQILALLSSFPTAEDINKASIEQLQSIRYGKRNCPLPLSFIAKMKRLTDHSIGYKKGPGSGYVVQSLIGLIQLLQSEIQILKDQIVELYSQVSIEDSLLCSIDGITKETAIVLEAYIGDVSRFATAKQIVAYFGMNPTVNRSGKATKRQSYLEKKGSGIVRHKLFMAMLSIIRSEKGPIYQYYDRLVESGKPKMVAICGAMRKLLVIIYAILKNQEPFDIDRV